MQPKTLRNQSGGTRLYVCVVVTTGAAAVCLSTYDLVTSDIGWNWAILAVLTLLSGSATVALPSLPATVSVSETFVFTSVLLFGSSAGTMTVALDAAVISFWSYRTGQPLYKILFNVCALPLAIWLSSHLFFFLATLHSGRSSGVLPMFRNPDSLNIGELLAPLFAFTVAYFILNSCTIAFAIALEKHLNAFTIWRDNFAKLSLNYFGGASIAALFVTYTREINYASLIIIFPLLIVLYYTFAISMGRAADANSHLTELNTLYMATIETLAMAIDAKDQVTHGHIRRVQLFAVRLAQQLGVNDVKLIRAIEAAALLHDMGKLAVPEYILNKPGSLTASEYETMKLHAPVGAEILSSINFPYPVVPIVRHHHESWDGSGYPDGLKGSQIPLGARILSVVDCFDALTSDRPYRSRLSDSEAIAILLDRRGTMYDPLVVDTFINTHRESPFTIDAASESHVDGISAITRATSLPSEAIAAHSIAGTKGAGAAQITALYDIATALSEETEILPVSEIVFTHVQKLLPVSTLVLYLYDKDRDELLAKFSRGAAAAEFDGMRIPRGQRLSGWVAANKTSIMNSDASLDFGESGQSLAPPLRSCLSIPLLVSEHLAGVATAYSTVPNAYNDEHRRFLELVGRQVSQTLQRCEENPIHPPATTQQNEQVNAWNQCPNPRPGSAQLELGEDSETRSVPSVEHPG